jgi:hypothetical protein
MLKESARVLKTNGFIVISTPNRYRFTNVIRLITTGQVRLVSPHHVTEYTMGQIIEQLRFSNFTVKEVIASPSGGSRYPVKLLSRLLRTILFCVRSPLAFEATLFFVAKPNTNHN